MGVLYPAFTFTSLGPAVALTLDAGRRAATAAGIA